MIIKPCPHGGSFMRSYFFQSQFKMITWFEQHFEKSECDQVVIKDVCELFRFTTGLKTHFLDVIKTLEAQNIEIKRDMKTSSEYYRLPYVCKTHQILHVGLTDAADLQCTWVTCIHSRADGDLTAAHLGDRLCRELHIVRGSSQKASEPLTFAFLNGHVGNIIPRDMHQVYLKDKLRKQFVVIEDTD